MSLLSPCLDRTLSSKTRFRGRLQRWLRAVLDSMPMSRRRERWGMIHRFAKESGRHCRDRSE
ncbi:hypothetical protein [Imhoffiella purpurea]|uniref:Uncharacterized protein n=1 Tax=Imhoffiella purpurea TaxID=1249627 RepID=W9VD83_9GAMM|nr:hypothetical protein [Imhoffiella purpurea]EXJ14941.1 hypothetical protein D779_1996 [Imhoffiella purpurea]